MPNAMIIGLVRSEASITPLSPEKRLTMTEAGTESVGSGDVTSHRKAGQMTKSAPIISLVGILAPKII